VLDENLDILVFTVRHTEYLDLDINDILKKCINLKVLVDAFNIIDDDKAKLISKKGIKLIGVGKGHWKKLNMGNSHE